MKCIKKFWSVALMFAVSCIAGQAKANTAIIEQLPPDAKMVNEAEDPASQVDYMAGGNTTSYQDQIMSNPTLNERARANAIMKSGGNTAVIIQNGQSNKSSIIQNGDNNFASQTQNGVDNDLRVEQRGANNRSIERQTGSRNRKVKIQNGVVEEEVIIQQVKPSTDNR